MPFLYLLALLTALTGMIVLDRRFRLFFWRSPKRAAAVLLIGLAFFLLWDLQGIRLHIFFRGETSFMTGWQFAPELPIEEPFFLLLLCYLTMNLYGFLAPRVRRAHPGGRVAASAGGRVSRPSPEEPK